METKFDEVQIGNEKISRRQLLCKLSTGVAVHVTFSVGKRKKHKISNRIIFFNKIITQIICQL